MTPNDREIEGRFFEAGSAMPRKAVLSGDRVAPVLVLEDGTRLSGAAIVRVSDRLAKVPRKLFFDDGSVFETPDNAAIDSRFVAHGGLLARLHLWETSWKTVAVISLATIGLVYALFAYGLPAGARAAAAVTPEIALTAIDKGSLQSVDRAFFSQARSDQATRDRISTIFEELVAASGQETPRPQLLFRNGGSIGANAFALPGGTVIVTDQLIEMANNDDEIAGVLAHEIGHVAGRHSLKQIYRVLGVGFMVTVIGGDASQLIDEVAAQAALIQNFSYSRAFEAESDRYSVELMMKLGRDPEAFVDLLDRITDNAPSSRRTSWYSTHPGTEDRREAVRELVAEIEGRN